MTQWIVFLRGVNVGGNNKLPMKELRAALEGAGFAGVQTYIQSGNLVFQSDHQDAREAGEAVTALIEKTFGFAPRSHTLTAAALHKAINENPYRQEGLDEPKSVHFHFLSEDPGAKADLEALTALKTETERFALTDNVFYLLAPDGIGRSKLAEKIDRHIRVPMTARNMRSVYKVAAIAGLDVEDL